MLLTILLTLIAVLCFLALSFIVLQMLFDHFDLKINVAKINDSLLFILIALTLVLVVCSTFAPHQLLK
jgi:uncharacterized BrkB/YihY/UPF0761 family membrane protein